ncbi:MAG: hypothetical protein AUJ92_03455 [Armatimonadetes bacterium CG2_30_59_28]|nr:hypothetical protein [Armatimonadota bacterium]OIO97512.1 MAG: hypothetical protein AUJ92_03455 [Armatimonadetes bacterium CG2_30_59_28]PIU64280.1 MAG: hypothetical protein COS85_13030 [Armatimonadetes bacterium CG07_land_8_20_14_0_80_59_28]PIX38144.1 MAG: hypothetical protein COZ56_21225 [Armatimonadetes bacterium CG_4_8_14_3_um_filter_58_9]PIY45589.1 MAG: hypothetical protein COZ05_06480 [Armatimonadetes bacterium CG_4_10_14_3_um_filter_59_10]PJB65778.1 MAG: hypothetical protein CO095_137
MQFEALYYDGWSSPPSYILVGAVEGNAPDEALKNNLEGMNQALRDQLALSVDDVNDRRIRDTLYLLKPDDLACARRGS